MNIGFLTHTGSSYGANRSLSALVDGHQPTDARLFLIAPEESQITRDLRHKGVRVAIIPEVRAFRELGAAAVSSTGSASIRLNRNGGIAAACFEKIVARLGKWNTQVVYSNSAMVTAGAQAAAALGLPHVWHLREFGDLDYHREPAGGWDNARTSMLRSDATISVSEAVRRHFLSPPRAGRDFVIDNGVIPRESFNTLQQRREQRTRGLPARHAFKFVLVGRIQQGKGQESAIRAMSKLSREFPHARLVIVGGGDTPGLKALASRSGVEKRVIFRGYVQNPIAEMLDADVALMCSRYEAFGRVTAEAMAAGLPVIGHNAGGTPELVQHGTNGLLYSGDVDSLAERMAQLAADPSWSRELGMAGWEIAKGRFSVESYASNVWNVIQRTYRNTIPSPAA